MIDENEVIKIILTTVLGDKTSKIGDDVAISDQNLIIKTDMLVSTTDVPKQMNLTQASKKAVAMCVSDFAAKGVKPVGFLVSLGIPRGTTKEQIKEIALGLKEASLKWGLKLYGGDTNLSKELIISCTMFGFSDKIVTRDGAKPGEVVVTNGYFGYTASGLKILMNKVKYTNDFGKKAISSVLNPEPRLNDGLILSRYLTSSIDSSDGLSISLHTLSRMSGVKIVINKKPTNDDVYEFASLNGINVDELVFFGGEEYLIVGTMRKNEFRKARKEIEENGGILLKIGYTTRGLGVEVKDGKRGILPEIGWVYSF